MFNIGKSILRQALDLSPVATLIVDRHGSLKRVAYANQAFEALSGYDASELLGRKLSSLISSDEHADTVGEHEVEIKCNPRLGVAERLAFNVLPLYDRPGTPRYWLATEQNCFESGSEYPDGDREALLSVLRDARMHLRRLDGRDSTTGILGRRAFEDLLQRDWVMARRERRSLGLMLFRIDSFEAYRELFGRHAADACLRKVAHAITGSLRRASDLAARFSDDRFAVLVAEDDHAKLIEFAASIAGRVRGLSIHHPRSVADRFVTVSTGSAIIVPATDKSPASLIEQAEAGLSAGAEQVKRGFSAL